MKKTDSKKLGDGITVSKAFTADLRGKQSVRATFKLTEKAIEMISIVAAQLGIKQKSLFDHLIEDTHYLNSIAREIQLSEFIKQVRIQKTYVISRKTLCCLEDASKNFSAPRDALVEYSIQRLLPIIAEEREKHLNRKEILNEITEYLQQGDKILRKSREVLGEQDPVYDQFKTAMTVCHNAHCNINSFVEKGKIIEDF